MGEVPYSGGPSGDRIDNNIIQSTGTAAGSPIVVDSNVIGIWFNNDALSPNTSVGGMPSIWVTMTSWAANVNGLLYFDGLSTAFHGVKIDGPGENGSGGGHNSLFFHNWVSESLEGTEGLIVHDTGPNAPGAGGNTFPVSGISIHNLNNSDPVGGPAVHTLFQELGSVEEINGVDLNAVAAFGGLLSCPNTTACNDRPVITGNATGSSSALGGTWGGQFVVDYSSNAIHAEMPVLMKLAYGQFAAKQPAWAQVFPPPNQFSITGTGAGSLAAATYCMAVEGKDSQPTAGLTLPSNTLCQAVGGSSSIVVQWFAAGGSLSQAYGGYRFFFCSTGGSSCVPNTYLDLSAAVGSPVVYTFTSTAGGTGGTLNMISTAYLSYLYWDSSTYGKSCLLCAANNNAAFPLGIGDPNPQSGAKLSVSGGAYESVGILVGSLPAAAAGNAGQFRSVSDSTSITAEGQACVGGSTHTALAFSDGTVWKCF
jgi:hypothetical protein